MRLSLPASVSTGRGVDWWIAAWIALAITSAAPLGWKAYQRLTEVGIEARTRLIAEHQLWEVETGYRGNPRMYTRLAARLLSDSQLARRLQAKYGAQSAQIELEYRRDLSIARALVVLKALAYWALPLGAIYAAIRLWRRRRPRPVPRTQPASASDPRYKPPEPTDRPTV